MPLIHCIQEYSFVLITDTNLIYLLVSDFFFNENEQILNNYEYHKGD